MTTNIFPIHCKLVNSEGEAKVEILQITHTAMLVDSLASSLVVNKSFTAQFTFPIIDRAVEVPVVIYRTYGELLDPKSATGRKMRQMNELVFKKPERPFNEALIKFLAEISHRQKS